VAYTRIERRRPTWVIVIFIQNIETLEMTFVIFIIYISSNQIFIHHTNGLERLELILENNFLEFNGTFYKEGIGLAQGSKCSPMIADIYKYQRCKFQN
jgi:hypothetical protein